jgi:hypothetical protein
MTTPLREALDRFKKDAAGAAISAVAGETDVEEIANVVSGMADMLADTCVRLFEKIVDTIEPQPPTAIDE